MYCSASNETFPEQWKSRWNSLVEEYMKSREYAWLLDKEKRFPMTQYACLEWHTHSRRQSPVTVVNEMKLLSNYIHRQYWLRACHSIEQYPAVREELDKGTRCALYIAALLGLVAVVAQAVADGYPVDAQVGEYGGALHAACQTGHSNVAKVLLANGAQVNHGDKLGRTPLYNACAKGYHALVKLLLTQGANANQTDNSLCSPLIAASLHGHLPVVELLLAKEADVNYADSSYGSALTAACLNGHLYIVRLLLVKEADVNYADSSYGSALTAACLNGHLYIVRLLLVKEADVNYADGPYGSALTTACLTGHLSVVRLLLAKEADVNCADGYQRSPLSAACLKGFLPIVELLLAKGADVNQIGDSKRSPLIAACSNGSLPIVKLLLAQGADVNQIGDSKRSPLIAACSNGSLPIVKLLLAQGADVNYTGGYYDSPLTAACSKGSLPIVKLLLAKGADVNRTVTSQRCTVRKGGLMTFKEVLLAPLHAAVAFGRAKHFPSRHSPETALALLTHGADANMEDSMRRTPLMLAACCADLATVEVLLGHGASVMRESSGRSAVQYARLRPGPDSVEIVQSLINHGAEDLAPDADMLKDAEEIGREKWYCPP